MLVGIENQIYCYLWSCCVLVGWSVPMIIVCEDWYSEFEDFHKH